MQRYQSYVQGQWVDGGENELDLFNAITGEKIGETSSLGLIMSVYLSMAEKKVVRNCVK